MKIKDYKLGHVIEPLEPDGIEVKLLSEPYLDYDNLCCAKVIHIKGACKGNVTDYCLHNTRYLRDESLAPIQVIKKIGL